MSDQLFWAPWAWMNGHWAQAVLLRVGADGHWVEVRTGTPAPAQAQVLRGPVMAGLVNAHSHAFQRAFAGLSERRDQAQDDFWSWRDRMYGVALRITPAQLRAVAAQLYAELLHGGYTQVCEFHYLHHDRDGTRYADPWTLSWAIADAAGDVGMGMTMLPVLYERAGFAQPTLRSDQRRFATNAKMVLALQQALDQAGRPLLNAGVAVHSLRAAASESIRQLVDGLGSVPIHVHVAEQTAEVEDCLRATGERPIQWLARHAGLDKRWQLVHATHSTRDEIDLVARSQAGVVICPSTEANLGDGLADLPGWLGRKVALAIGSDSHITRAWLEELRWMEYGQRLHLRQRNVGAAPEEACPSTAARWLGLAQGAGAMAAGFKTWGLVSGARADLLVIDPTDAPVLGMPQESLLDALVFSSPSRGFMDVMVAGRWVLRDHRCLAGDAVAERFAIAMSELWRAG